MEIKIQEGRKGGVLALESGVVLEFVRKDRKAFCCFWKMLLGNSTASGEIVLQMAGDKYIDRVTQMR